MKRMRITIVAVLIGFLLLCFFIANEFMHPSGFEYYARYRDFVTFGGDSDGWFSQIDFTDVSVAGEFDYWNDSGGFVRKAVSQECPLYLHIGTTDVIHISNIDQSMIESWGGEVERQIGDLTIWMIRQGPCILTVGLENDAVESFSFSVSTAARNTSCGFSISPDGKDAFQLPISKSDLVSKMGQPEALMKERIGWSM